MYTSDIVISTKWWNWAGSPKAMDQELIRD